MSIGSPFPTFAELEADPATLSHALRDGDEESLWVRRMPQTWAGPQTVGWTRVCAIPPAGPARSLDAATTILERRADAHPLLGFMTSSARVAVEALRSSAPFEVALLCARLRVPGGFAAAMAAALRALSSAEREPAFAAEIRWLAALAEGGEIFSAVEPGVPVEAGPDPDAEARRFDAEVREILGRSNDRIEALLAQPRAAVVAGVGIGILPPYVLPPEEAVRRVRAAVPTSGAWHEALTFLTGQPLAALRPLLIDLLETPQTSPVPGADRLGLWSVACRAIATSDRSIAAVIAEREREERRRRDAQAEAIAARALAAMRTHRPASSRPGTLERVMLAVCLLGVMVVTMMTIASRDRAASRDFDWRTPYALPDLDELFPCRFDDECVAKRLDAVVLAADSAGDATLTARAREAAAAIRAGDCARAERAAIAVEPPQAPALEQAWRDASGALFWRCLSGQPWSSPAGSSSPAPSRGSSSDPPPPR